MRRNLSPHALVLVSLMCILVLAACSGGGPVLQYVGISPSGTTTISATTSQQYTATAYYSNGTHQDATSLATWTSSNTGVAMITGGVALGIGAGTTTITASLAGVPPASATLDVNQLTSIAVSPLTTTIAIAGSQTYTAAGTFKNFDGSTSTSDVTSLVNSVSGWSSSKPTVATIVNNTGVATGVAGGSTQITATLYGVTSTPPATLTVSGAAVPVSLQLAPAAPTIAIHNAATFTAQELWSDQSLHALSAPVTWSSGTAATAEIGSAPELPWDWPPGPRRSRRRSRAATPSQGIQG